MNEVNYTSENPIEADIKKVSQEVIEKKQSLENQGASERELVKQAIHPQIHTQPGADSTQVATSATAADDKVLPDYLKDSPQELKLKVESLVELVFNKGIKKAAHEAQKFGPFVLDAFHDAVTDKIYEELKKRKII